jgi:hypothetical protein
MSATKKCRICGITKSKSEFNVDNHKTGYLRAYCKKCHSKETRKWIDNNKDKNRDMHLSINRRNKGKHVFTPSKPTAHPNVLKIRGWGRRERAKALKEGVITKPNKCDKCSYDGDKYLNAIIEDYENPLNILGWYCKSCASRWFRDTNQKDKLSKYTDVSYILPFNRGKNMMKEEDKLFTLDRDRREIKYGSRRKDQLPGRPLKDL